MAISQELQAKVDLYEQAYFSIDEPVPFVGGLKIYPVLSKDYYRFYSNLPCLTMDKTVKKVKAKDDRGKDIIKEVANPEGISKSYMAYLIDQMENPEIGAQVTAQVINILELVFHEENGLYCPKCGFKRNTMTLIKDIGEFKTGLSRDMSPEDQEKAVYDFMNEYMLCPECKSELQDFYRIKNSSPKQLCVRDHEFTPPEFDEMIAIVTHQNILDYTGDRYMDPNLKKDMELKAELENKDYTAPGLEKMLVCISISTPYTIKQLQEEVTLRKLSMLLRTIDSKNTYYAQYQGQMSGMVSFKAGHEPKHWIFSSDKKNISKEIMTMNDLQAKFANVT